MTGGDSFPRTRRFVPRTTPLDVSGLRIEVHNPLEVRQVFDAAGKEVECRLPPYDEVPAYLVSDFTCPEAWARGDGENEMASFFPIRPGHMGLWFDFNNLRRDRHHVAILISVQGVNAITGMPAGMKLEQYKPGDLCPRHKDQGIRLGTNLHCPECGYDWPAQNFMSDAWPEGYLWLDGWRMPGDKKTRQFIMTEEAARGVAAHILGNKRTFNIGIAVFRSIEQKPEPVRSVRRGGYVDDVLLGGGYLGGGGYGLGSESYRFGGHVEGGPVLRRMAFSAPQLEVGAGATIRQATFVDPHPLSAWRNTPDAVFILHYAPEEFVRELLQHPTYSEEDVVRGEEGFLAHIPTGNPDNPQG